MASLILVLLLAAVALYLLGQIPMDPAIFNIIRVVVIIACVLFVIEAFGLLAIPVPRLR